MSSFHSPWRTCSKACHQLVLKGPRNITLLIESTSSPWPVTVDSPVIKSAQTNHHAIIRTQGGPGQTSSPFPLKTCRRVLGPQPHPQRLFPTSLPLLPVPTSWSRTSWSRTHFTEPSKPLTGIDNPPARRSLAPSCRKALSLRSSGRGLGTSSPCLAVATGQLG